MINNTAFSLILASIVSTAPLLLAKDIAQEKEVQAGSSEVAANFSICHGKDKIDFPMVVAKLNHEAVVEVTTGPQTFPTKWNPPRRQDPNQRQSGLVMPCTPCEYEVASPGWTLRYSCDSVDGGLIRLTGAITYVDMQSIKGVHGENSEPIYSQDKEPQLLTKNETRSATTFSSETRFQVFAKPGKEYDLEVSRLNEIAHLVVECNFK